MVPEQFKDKVIPVLDQGYIMLVDVMGDDEAIVDAARVSYAQGTKKKRGLRGLIDYLMRKRHCYHPNMEVLTIHGWVRWGDLAKGEEVDFLVPNPNTGRLQPECLVVKSWTVENETMECFSNSKMAYSVTTGHTMRFKKKQFRGTVTPVQFEKYKVEEMPHWGHFDPLRNYSWISREGDMCPRMQFVGFYLGNGHAASTNRVTFHLVKQREKEYLLHLIDMLDLDVRERPSSSHPSGTLFTVVKPDFLDEYTNFGVRAKDKFFSKREYNLSAEEIRGLFDGMLHSDGNISKDRPQYSYHSISPYLLHTFVKLAAYMGMDSPKCKTPNTVVVYHGDRTSLEARQEYFGQSLYSGEVYCATTSTGWLMVRGEHGYGFVCGNTSPFEMGEMKFEVKLPIFVERQWVRHRTCSMNEMSGRYSEFPEEWHLPDEFRMQDTTNKQGSFGDLDRTVKDVLTLNRQTLAKQAWDVYRTELEGGVAREQARENLPVSVYTKKVWKMDLHNLFHFLKLRTDPHAQKEIRMYADIVEQMVAACFPLSYEAWRNHVKDAVTLSRDEQAILALLLGGNYDVLADAAEGVLSEARQAEFRGKLSRICSEPPKYLESFLKQLERSPQDKQGS